MHLRLSILLFSLLLVAACDQENGDPCQVDSDCTSGYCHIGCDDPLPRGYCAAPAEACEPDDSAVPVRDAGVDASIDVSPDASTDASVDPDVDAG